MANNKIKRVYIAGLLTPKGYRSTNPAIDYLINIREMTRCGLEAFLAGYDPFVPAFDWLFWLVAQEGQHITEPMIKRYSKAWLSVCDAVVLTPGWRQSSGTLAEIKFAEELGIPVFESLEDLIKHEEEKHEG